MEATEDTKQVRNLSTLSLTPYVFPQSAVSCYNKNYSLAALLNAGGILVDNELRESFINELTWLKHKAGLFLFQYYFDAQIEAYDTRFPWLAKFVQTLDKANVRLTLLVSPVLEKGPSYVAKTIVAAVVKGTPVSVTKPAPHDELDLGLGLEAPTTEPETPTQTLVFEVDMDLVRNYFGDNAEKVFPLVNDSFLQGGEMSLLRKRKKLEELYNKLQPFVDLSVVKTFNEQNAATVKTLYTVFNRNLISSNYLGQRTEDMNFSGEYVESIEKIDSLSDNNFVTSRDDLKAALLNENSTDWKQQVVLSDYLIKQVRGNDQMAATIKEKTVDFQQVLDYADLLEKLDAFSELEDVPLFEKKRVDFTYGNRVVTPENLGTVSEIVNTNSPEEKAKIKTTFYRWRDLYNKVAYFFYLYDREGEFKGTSFQQLLELLENFPTKWNKPAREYGKKVSVDLNSVDGFRVLIQALNSVSGFKLPELTTKYVRPKTTEDKLVRMLQFEFQMFIFYGVEKQVSTYLEGYLAENLHKIASVDKNYVYLSSETGSPEFERYRVLRPYWNVMGLKTKRWSSGIHTYSGGSDAMATLVCEPENGLLYYDISAAEVRIAVYLAKDEKFQKLFDDGKDPYIFLGAKAFPDHAEDKAYLRSWRQIFKGLVLGLLYGRGAASVAKAVGIPVQQAKELQELFFAEFPGMKPFITARQKYAEKYGFIDSFFGDKISVSPERSFTQGINYVVQNSATAILAEAFGNFNLQSRKNGRPVFPRIVVHDSMTVGFRFRDLVDIYNDVEENFKGYVFRKYGIKLKYDLIIHVLNHRDKIEFSLDRATGNISASGDELSITTLRNVLQKYYDFQELSCEVVKPAQTVYEKAFYEAKNPKFKSFHPDSDCVLYPTLDVKWNVQKK